jgi:hypothetical protein
MRVVGFITQAPGIRNILDHIGRRFDPLKLPGRSPPMSEDFLPDPFPDYGPQYGKYTDGERPPETALRKGKGSVISGRSA